MFKYSQKTEVNKVFKLNELFKIINASKEVKQDASVIESLKLSNILSSESTNFEETENFEAIYIIDVVVKDKAFPKFFLDEFNKNINFQTLFKVYSKSNVNYYSSLKVIDEENVKVLKTFESGWQDQDIVDLPQVTYLEEIFKEIISYISTYRFKANETMQEYVSRLAEINKKKVETEKLEKTMRNEKQPNLKMELNDKLKLLKKQLQDLEV